MPDRKKLKTCFLIAPIGEDGGETRLRSDQILSHIVAPATEECGYRAIRADKISEPGLITSQVIQHLLDDQLVIADLTGHNPNVFYELAVRHAVRKPCVQIIQTKEPIPFDVAQSRTIQVDHRDLDSVAQCKVDLVGQIRSVEKDPTKVDTPISTAVDLQSLRQSENPLEKSNAKILSMLSDLRNIVVGLDKNLPRSGRMSNREFTGVQMAVRDMDRALTLREDEQPTKTRFEEARKALRQLQRAFVRIVADIGPTPGGDFVILDQVKWDTHLTLDDLK